jgi:NADH-quinone oxidoreductase subunit N
VYIDLQTIAELLPEIFLIGVATILFVGGAFVRMPRFWLSITIAAELVATYMVWRQSGDATSIHGPIIADHFGDVVRWLATTTGLLLVLAGSRTAKSILSTEFLGSMLVITAGVMLVGRANELVFLFLGLELISIPTYVLLYLGRQGRGTAESTAKYFFLSILSSAIFLYGLSFVYGLAGTTTLLSLDSSAATIQSAFMTEPSTLGGIALVLVLAGLGFKIAAVPFHFYAPDVYQGVSHGNAALLSIAPKLAGIVAIIRLVLVGMPGANPMVWQLLLVIAVITMTLGNVSALWQTDLRRMMAYSSIAHSGYMLIGLAAAAAAPAPTQAYGGIAAVLFYVCVYAFATVGFFAALSYLGDDEESVRNVDDLAGLAISQPMIAAAIALFLFSLAGIPPLAGFWGKLTLLTGSLDVAIHHADPAARKWFLVLAITGGINAAIAAAYYLRIISVMFFRSSPTARRSTGGWQAAAVVVSALLVVLLGLDHGHLADATREAENKLLLPVIELEQSTPDRDHEFNLPT